MLQFSCSLFCQEISSDGSYPYCQQQTNLLNIIYLSYSSYSFFLLFLFFLSFSFLLLPLLLLCFTFYFETSTPKYPQFGLFPCKKRMGLILGGLGYLAWMKLLLQRELHPKHGWKKRERKRVLTGKSCDLETLITGLFSVCKVFFPLLSIDSGISSKLRGPPVLLAAEFQKYVHCSFEGIQVHNS